MHKILMHILYDFKYPIKKSGIVPKSLRSSPISSSIFPFGAVIHMFIMEYQ